MNPYDQPPQNPYGSKDPTQNPFGPAPPQHRASLSPLAIVSLLAGLLSLPAAFLCCLNVPIGLIAIVTGHIAFAQIGSSRGARSGKGVAVAGFGLGYLSFVLMLLVPMFAVLTSDEDPGTTSGAQNPLDRAESAIRTDAEGVAYGNTQAAVDLAAEFSTTMDSMDEALFTQTDSKIKLSGGHYVTWCELREGSCAFVVHVPEYRKFEDDAKEELAKIAWRVAQTHAIDVLEEGDELAVGLKGLLFYGSVRVGTVTDSEDDDAGLSHESKDKEDLYPFFEAEAIDITAESKGPDAPEMEVDELDGDQGTNE